MKKQSARSDPPRVVRCTADGGDDLSLTAGQYYQVLSDPAEEYGMLRVVDNTGEDYLFDAALFELISDPAALVTDLHVSLTAQMKAIIFQVANQRGVSMAALMREWIDERLDLPANAA